MTKGLTIPSETDFTVQPADDENVTSREEERLIEGELRQKEIEAHVDTLDDEEKAKVDEFVSEKQNGEKETKSEKPLTAAQVRKRKKKAENEEERKKRRLERLKRKQDSLAEVGKELERQLNQEPVVEEEAKEGETETKKEEENDEAKPGREWTLSIALPGSILDNAQSPELRTYVAGQIARAASVCQVDEVIIFDESGDAAKDTQGEFTGVKKKGNPNQTLARILQYLECPQYLRKEMFPQHKDLKYAGLLNPLDTPHHLRASELSEYREGIVMNKPASAKKGKGAWVNCGLDKEVRVDLPAPAGTRVTVKFDEEQRDDGRFLTGQLILPAQIREESGRYWGYTVRLASSLSKVFEDLPDEWGEYDLTVGTSERGKSIDAQRHKPFKHGLVVFGGVRGLEHSFAADERMKGSEIEQVADLFDMWLNVMPTGQGSRTIRTEEAILVSLSTMRNKIFKY